MTDKPMYVYRVSFNEKLSVWQTVDAEIVSDKPLSQEEIEEKIKEECNYEEISTDLDWSECEREEVGEIEVDDERIEGENIIEDM